MAKKYYLENVTPVDNTRVNRPRLEYEDIEAPVTHIGISGQGLDNYHKAGIRYNIATGELTNYSDGKPVTRQEAVERIWNNYVPKRERQRKAFLNRVDDIMFDRFRKPEYKKYEIKGNTIRQIRND